METEPGNGNILRNLAQDMLSKEENNQLKDALQKYRKSASLTSLVSQLTKVIKGTEKLMLLVELSNALPVHLRKDFQKLCCLHFPQYESFLTYFTPGTVGERSRIITKDPSGQFQVVSSGVDDKAHFTFYNSDQTSLPGESGIDVNSDIDDICRHSDHNNNGNSLGPTWRIESKSGRSSSTSSHVSRSANKIPTPKNSISGSQHLQQSWKHSQTSLSTSQFSKTNIRNRARSLRVLSGSLPSVVAPQDNTDSRSDGKARILLKRHEDGSLGIGIKGGKEYNAPIVVYLVEPGSQAAAQGLRVGDQILDVNGTDFSNITHAEAVMMMRNAWNIIMVVQRPHETEVGSKDHHVSWGRMGREEFQVFLYPSKKGKLGCGVYRDDQGYLVVKNVEKNSAASKAGLWKHDRFVEIEGMKVAGLTDKQVASLTNVKRMRIKIQRFTGSTSSKGKASTTKTQQSDFNSVMSLDLSSLGLGDEDIVSSTPRRPPGRSHSEDRWLSKPTSHLYPHHHHQHQYGIEQQQQGSHPPHNYQRAFVISATQLVGEAAHSDKEMEEEQSMELVTRTVKVDVHCSKSPRETTADKCNKNNHEDEEDHKITEVIDDIDSNEMEFSAERANRGIEDKEDINLSPEKSPDHDEFSRLEVQEDINIQDWDHTSEVAPAALYSPEKERQASPVRRHHSQPHAQSSVYPYSQHPSGFVQHQNYHNSHYQQHQARTYRPRLVHQSHQNHQQMVAFHSKRSLARYMTSSGLNHGPQTLPSKAAMLYSPTPFVTAGELERDRSRPKKRGTAHSSSATSKMRQLRHRSQSPHAVHLQNNQSRDREFLRAIQNSVERRQRAHRLSLYQLPDQDDDAWNIG